LKTQQPVGLGGSRVFEIRFGVFIQDQNFKKHTNPNSIRSSPMY